MSTLLITDTTALIALDAIGRLNELRDRHAFRLADALYEWVVREAGEA